ncbi:MAG: multidrug efflux RND transporter periplasmic adaptor subunit MexX [Halioglobus sp.]
MVFSLSLHRVLACVLFLSLIAVSEFATGQAPKPVGVAIAREEAIQRTVQLTGTVTSARAASLSAASSGLVTALLVDAGSEVAEGELLLELDPELARLQWQSAQAAVSAARAGVTDARRRLQEARALAPKQSIAETAVRDLEAEVLEDEALLQEATAEAAYREAVLERHRLRAPFGGVVTAKLTELGEWVVPGVPVLELVSTANLRIDFPVAEDYLVAASEASRLRYLIGEETSGKDAKVMTVVPVSDPGARTFLLRAQAVEADSRLVPGLSVRGRLSLSTGRRSVVVPRDALIRYPDGRIVIWVVEAGDKVAERIVRAGIEFDGLVEITSGLRPRERVVIAGNEALQAGQVVSIRQQDAN